MGLADGPTEVHKLTLAREILKDYAPTADVFPTYHLPRLRQAALVRYHEVLARHGRADNPFMADSSLEQQKRVVAQ